MNKTSASSSMDAPPELPGLAVRTGRSLFPRRILVALPALVAGAFLIRPRNLFGEWQSLGLLASLALVAAGLALRAWAAASAGGHTRSGLIEAPQLVTGGPYAFVRNPIYLGSFVLGLGMIGLLQDPWLLLPHAFVFAIFFGAIIPAEERFLVKRFGDEYLRFCGAVPRLVPALRPWDGRVHPTISWRAARGEAAIALLLLVIYTGFRALVIFGHRS